MLTLFSIPKPFTGQSEIVQWNALRSWCAFEEVQVVLVGDEPGVHEAATEARVAHVGGILTNSFGTPRLDDAFQRVEELARGELRCFVNADVILLDDFLPAVAAGAREGGSFLLVGQTVDLAVEEELALAGTTVRRELADRARREGVPRGPTAIDYFVFTPRLFDPVPPFVVGRAKFDNWLVWRGRARGRVIDMTDAVLAVHQRHDYRHVAGGHHEAYYGREADENLALAGGKARVYTLNDASHRLRSDGRLTRNWSATLRARETVRKVSWKLRHG